MSDVNSKNSAAVVFDDVCKTFRTHTARGGAGVEVVALDHVSFSIMPGETFALVGESGSGKTTTGRILAGLERADSGYIEVGGQRRSATRTPRRSSVQLVFQDPFSALDPRCRVSSSISEPLQVAGGVSKAEVKQRVDSIADAVGLTPSMLEKFPHELSGGQRQRVNIARALIGNPRLVVFDEPVSALDVSIQAQVLNLLKDLQEEFDTTFLFISHDMSVVRFVADRAAVMHHGRIVEIGQTEQILTTPKDEYTAALIEAIPIPGRVLR